MNCDNCLNTQDNETCDLTGEKLPKTHACREWEDNPNKPLIPATRKPPEAPQKQVVPEVVENLPEPPEVVVEPVLQHSPATYGFVNHKTKIGYFTHDEELVNAMSGDSPVFRFFPIDDTLIQALREAALKKLTPYERKLLGLEDETC